MDKKINDFEEKVANTIEKLKSQSREKDGVCIIPIRKGRTGGPNRVNGHVTFHMINGIYYFRIDDENYLPFWLEFEISETFFANLKKDQQEELIVSKGRIGEFNREELVVNKEKTNKSNKVKVHVVIHYSENKTYKFRLDDENYLPFWLEFEISEKLLTNVRKYDEKRYREENRKEFLKTVKELTS